LPSPTLDQLQGDLVYLGNANIFVPPEYPADWHSPVGVLHGLDEIQDYYHHPDYRHNGQNAANFSFIDGHVQTVNFEDRFDEIKLYPK
jgi:prepilin-type processing-associated H-X9-DG protein